MVFDFVDDVVVGVECFVVMWGRGVDLYGEIVDFEVIYVVYGVGC